MERLNIVCWKWKPPDGFYRSKFTGEHVNVLRSMCERNYRRPHTFTCVTDDPTGIDPRVNVIKLWGEHAKVRHPWGTGQPSCYRRLRAFSREAVEMFGPRIVSLDLDVVITGDCAPLWDRPEDFVIWGDTNPTTPYNGSMFLLRTGTHVDVWDTFDPVRSPRATKQRGYFGSDQAWIATVLGPDEPRWGKRDGVYSYRNDLRLRRERTLPEGCRIVFFHGRYDPWFPEIMAKYPWVREHWR